MSAKITNNVTIYTMFVEWQFCCAKKRAQHAMRNLYIENGINITINLRVKKNLLWELLWQVCYLDATIRFLAVGFPLLRNLHDCRRYLWILNGVVVLLWMKALVYRMDPPSPNDLWNTQKKEKKSKKEESIKNNGYNNNQIALFRQK